MATNRVFRKGDQFEASVVSGAVSGDPVLVGGDTAGKLPAVCLIDRNATTGRATVQCDGAFDLSVKGIDQSGNSAVAEGDIIYYVAADTPKLSKKNTGVRFGTAIINPKRATDLSAPTTLVASAGTATICVRLGT